MFSHITCFKTYSSEELENLIKNYPLNRQHVDYIFNDIKGFEFTDGIAVPGLLCLKRDGKYIIKIRKSDPEEEQKKSVIHEILHIKDKVHGTSDAECLLEKETERICRENLQLTDYIFGRAKNFSS